MSCRTQRRHALLSRVLLLLPVLLLPVLLSVGCVTLPETHVGPVTGIVVREGVVFSCSQAGVHTGTGWIRPEFRPTNLDVRGDSILVVGGDPGEAGSVALFARTGARALGEKRLADDLVYTVGIHPDGESAAVGCADGAVRLVSLPDLEVRRDLTKHTAPCRALRFSADGRFLATGGLDGLVYLHDLEAATTRVLKDHTAGIESLLFHGGRLYSGARDGKVRIHNRGRLVRTSQGMRQPVLALTGAGTFVFAGLRDGRILRLDSTDATYTEAAAVNTTLFSLTTTSAGFLVGTTNACVPVRL